MIEMKGMFFIAIDDFVELLIFILESYDLYLLENTIITQLICFLMLSPCHILGLILDIINLDHTAWDERFAHKRILVCFGP